MIGVGPQYVFGGILLCSVSGDFNGVGRVLFYASAVAVLYCDMGIIMGFYCSCALIPEPNSQII